MNALSPVRAYSQPVQTFAAQMSHKNFDEIKARLNEKPIVFTSAKDNIAFEVTGDMLDILHCRQATPVGCKFPKWLHWLKDLVEQVREQINMAKIGKTMSKSERLIVGVIKHIPRLETADQSEAALQRTALDVHGVLNQYSLKMQEKKLGKSHPDLLTSQPVIIGKSQYSVFVQPNKYDPDKD